MRYDTKISFYDSSAKKYDPRIHGYTGGTKLIAEQMANCTDLGINRSMQIFGALKQGQKTIRLMKEPPTKWSFLMIENDDKHYQLSTYINVSKGYAMIVGTTDDSNQIERH